MLKAIISRVFLKISKANTKLKINRRNQQS